MTIPAKKLRQRHAPYADNLQRFIEEAKSAITIFPKVRWDDCVWDITDAAETRRSHNTRTDRLLFTEHAGSRVRIERRVAFAEPFADLAKACITTRQVNRGMVAGPQMVFLRMLRYVYSACPLPVRHDPNRLTIEHFVAAEAAVRLREKASSAYRIGQRLEEFATFLDRHRITPMAIEFRSSIPRLRSIEDRTDTDFQARAEKLPKAEVFDALAQISNSAALQQNDFDLLQCFSAPAVRQNGPLSINITSLATAKYCESERTILDDC